MGSTPDISIERQQNNKEYVVLNIATQESWKNDKGEYETRTEWPPRLCLEESLEVRQDSPEGAANRS